MSARPIENDTLSVLAQCEVIALDVGAVRLPDVHLDRKLYVSVNKVLEALGGKWNRGKKAHLFAGRSALDVEALLDGVVLSGTYDCPKLDGFFPTPSHVADIMARELVAAVDDPDAWLIEPSAGRGAIAGALVRAGHNRDCIDCIELRADNRAVLVAAGFTVVAPNWSHDFLAAEPEEWRPDGIAMNPPFNRGADVAHVSHALDLLSRPGGVRPLRAVMSAGVRFRVDEKTSTLRDRIAAIGGTIEDLPDGTFEGAGTAVRTVLVRVG